LLTGQWYDDTTDSLIYLFDDPSGNTIDGAYWSMAINFNNKSYITVDGIEGRKSNGHNFWLDTYSGAWDGVIVQNCTTRQSHNHGIAAGLGGFATTSEGVSDGLQILNNVFIENGIGAVADGDGTGFALNISGNSPTDYLKNVIVQGNTSTGNANGFKGDWFSNDIIFRYNTIADSGAGFTTDGGKNLRWYYNIINHADTSATGYAFAIFRWEGAPGPPFGFEPDSLSIYNNTIYGYKNGISLSDTMSNVNIKNNIYYGDFSDNTPVWMEGTGQRNSFAITNNNYYTGSNAAVFTISGVDTYNFTEWQALGNDANSFNVDPKFTNASAANFIPRSPFLDGAGVDVSLTLDYAGNVVTAPPDIGAYQFNLGYQNRFPRFSDFWRYKRH
jgi:hypothetical protein